MAKGKSLALGIIGSAIIGTGAMAADPLPIAITTVPTAPPVAAGPEVAIDIQNTLGFYTGHGLWNDFWAMVDVKSASGWGVAFDGYADTNILPGFYGYVDGGITLYRSIGQFDVGVLAAGGFSWPCCGGGFGVAASVVFEHEDDRLYINSENRLWFFPSFGFESMTEAEFDVSDRLRVAGYIGFYGFSSWYVDAGVEFDVTDKLSVWSWLGFHDSGFGYFELGATFDITDNLEISAELDFDGPFSLDYIEVWAELERQIGNRPLSLVGEVGVGMDPGFYMWAEVGVRYKVGGREDRGGLLF